MNLFSAYSIFLALILLAFAILFIVSSYRNLSSPECRMSLFLEDGDKKSYNDFIQSKLKLMNTTRNIGYTLFFSLVFFHAYFYAYFSHNSPTRTILFALAFIEIILILLLVFYSSRNLIFSIDKKGWNRLLIDYKVELKNFNEEKSGIFSWITNRNDETFYYLLRSFIKAKYPNSPSYHQVTKKHNIHKLENFSEDELKTVIIGLDTDPITDDLVKDMRRIGMIESDYDGSLYYWLAGICAILAIISPLIALFIFPENIVGLLFFFFWTGFFGFYVLYRRYTSPSPSHLKVILNLTEEKPKLDYKSFFQLVEMIESQFPYIQLTLSNDMGK